MCLSVCLYVCPRPHPTLLHGPGCNFGEWQGMPPSCVVVCYWADMPSVHGLNCYGNITRTRVVSEYMFLVVLCLVSTVVVQVTHTWLSSLNVSQIRSFIKSFIHLSYWNQTILVNKVTVMKKHRTTQQHKIRLKFTTLHKRNLPRTMYKSSSC